MFTPPMISRLNFYLMAMKLKCFEPQSLADEIKQAYKEALKHYE